MSTKMVHIGFNHFLDLGKVVAVTTPKSSPMKRTIQDAKEKGVLVDLTEGRKTKAVIFTTAKWVILSALEPATISGRIEGVA